jgi:N-acyl-L-homoserine lactone synthetase
MLTTKGFNLYFKKADSEKEIRTCQSIRYKVYCEERKWVKASACPNELEHDIYDEKSPTFIALDDDFTIVGLMRVINGGEYGTLPFMDHPAIRDLNISIATMAELSRYIVVSPRHRGLISHGIFRISHQYCKRKRITDYVILIEPSLRRLIERFYWFYEPICAPALYYGAFTYPAVCNAKKIESIWHKQYPENYQFYMDESNQISSEELVRG